MMKKLEAWLIEKKAFSLFSNDAQALTVVEHFLAENPEYHGNIDTFDELWRAVGDTVNSTRNKKESFFND